LGSLTRSVISIDWFAISNLQIYKNSHSATVRLVPINSQLKIELYGELAAMLSLGLGDKHKHPRSTDLGVQVTLVAGACCSQEPTIIAHV
jgi:hypothetical protein